jgi:hypothetical protein
VGQKLRWTLLPLLLSAVVCAAEDRFAVLEFFGRPQGDFCSAAGPAMNTLQTEFEGRAVLLEYDYDAFLYGRQDRFWATGVNARYLPLVMVGSGYRTSSGSVDYERVYRSMIDAEIARQPRASISAFWRRTGNTMRAYVVVCNLGPSDLEIDEEAMVWLIAYEKANIGVSATWVRSTAERSLPYDLEPGETAAVVLDTPPVGLADWGKMSGVVLVEDRPGGSGAYDMAQAVEALPAALSASPDHLQVAPGASAAEVELSGPHVLSWSAESDAPWIEVLPSSGESLPATVKLTVRPDLRPPSERETAVSFSASGDGMSFTTSVDLGVGNHYRRAGRRIRPSK